MNANTIKWTSDSKSAKDTCSLLRFKKYVDQCNCVIDIQVNTVQCLFEKHTLANFYSKRFQAATRGLQGARIFCMGLNQSWH